jgi:hypothetical protein
MMRFSKTGWPRQGRSLQPAEVGFVAERAERSEAIQARFEPPALRFSDMPLLHPGKGHFLCSLYNSSILCNSSIKRLC